MSEKYQERPVKGKTVLITGGTTGIGRATALLLAQQGARVMIFGRDQADLDAALTEIKRVSAGQEVFGLTADTSKPDDVERIFQEVDSRFGGLDILVNNAALPASDLASTSWEEIVYVINTNLLGYMHVAKLAIERMRTRQQGHIIIVGSMSAKVAERGSSVYVATKAGLHGLAEALRKEINEMGIKVSEVEPGEVGSDMNPRSVPEQRQAQEDLKQMRAEDIAACIHYCLVQPERVDVVLVQIRPHLQLV